MGKLEAVGAKVVGVVLNRVRGSASAQDAYGDAYSSAERDSAVPPAAGVEPGLSGSAGANGPAQGDLPQRVLVRTPAPGRRDGLGGALARPSSEVYTAALQSSGHLLCGLLRGII